MFLACADPPSSPPLSVNMKYARISLAMAFAALAPSAAAQLPFDLIEISDDLAAPEFPGIDFQFFPVGFEFSEAGGVAVMDYDNDSLLDVYLPNTEFHASKLYRNLGGGQFTDVAPALSVDEPNRRRAGGLFLDIENDGDLDLLTIGYPGYTANLDLYTLFRNDGAPGYGFTDVSASAGGFQLAPTADPTLLGDYAGTCAGDYNGDGYIDFFTTYWARLPGYLYDQMRLWRSEPNGPPHIGQTDYSERQFIDATITAGLDSWFEGSTWTPSFVDYNRDGYLDLHINVDFGMDILRLNDGNGAFLPDVATSVGLNGAPAETRNEMGITFGDIDHDGDLDQFQTNAYWGDRLYRNDSVFGAAGTGMAFEDYAPAVNAQLARFGWGTAFADMDNDADLDLLKVAGLVTPESNWYHENQWPTMLPDGKSPLFVDQSMWVPEFAKTQGNPLGDEDIARSLVPFDYDMDGDLDLIVTRSGISPYIFPGKHVRTAFYENTLSTTDGWIEINLRNKNGSRNVANARVYVHTPGLTQMDEVIVGSSYMAQQPDRRHFGLGSAQAINWIAVRWPDGTVSGKIGTPINSMTTVEYGAWDFLGDVNTDLKKDQNDLVALSWLIANPVLAEQMFGDLPYKIVGDMNGDNVLDSLDYALLDAIIP